MSTSYLVGIWCTQALDGTAELKLKSRTVRLLMGCKGLGSSVKAELEMQIAPRTKRIDHMERKLKTLHEQRRC